MDEYQERLAHEKQLFDENICVHDLPEIFHYWSEKYLRPRLNGVGYNNIEDFFVQEIARTPRQPGCALRIASVGCGDCAFEIRVANGLLARGIGDFTVLCLDISDVALDRGRGYASDAGVASHFEMVPHDFNQGLPDGVFDAVMANQSLHHVLELERLYSAISRQLATGGLFPRLRHDRAQRAHALAGGANTGGRGVEMDAKGLSIQPPAAA